MRRDRHGRYESLTVDLVSCLFSVALEEEYIRGAIWAGTPCLGLCFGAQLLAKILGARVFRAEEKEIGVVRLRLTPAGETDSLLSGFPPAFPVFQWHGDTFDLPLGAKLLVEGNECRNQMFQNGAVVGLQFHLEVTSAEAETWMDSYSVELHDEGLSAARLLSELRKHEQQMKRLSRLFLKNFTRWVAQRKPSRR